MLWSGPDWELGQVTRATDDTSRRRPATRSQAEQGLKCGHRGLPPVVTKDELVQVGLQVRTADAMVGSDEPLLQVSNRPVYARQDGRPSRSNLLGARDVVVARRLQATELLESVGVDGRPVGYVLGGEVGQRGLAEIRDDGHSGPARAGSALLDGDGHKRRFSALQLPTPAQTRLWSAHPRVVDFDLPVQGVPGGVDHGSPEFVQDPPGRLIPTDAQLVLKQQRRDPSLVGRHQIRGPKPHRQRHLRPVEDGASRPGLFLPWQKRSYWWSLGGAG